MGLFDRLFGKKKQEEQVVNEEQLAADQQELNTDEPVSTVIEEKKHADQKVDQKEEPVVPKEGLSSAQPKDSEQVLPRPTAEPTLINPSEETSENEEVSAEPVVTEPQIKPTSDEPVSPAAEPEPVAEEEDIVIDIDALADIFTQSREETEKKYEQSLSLTRKTFADGFNELFANFRTVDEEFFEELEETLIMSDVGVDLAMEITEELRKEAKLVNAKSTDDLRQLIIEKIVDKFDGEKLPSRLDIQPEGLTVLLFVGVNGVGKTTLIKMIIEQDKHIQQAKNVQIGYFSQKLDGLDESQSILENVMKESIHEEDFVRMLLARLLFKGQDVYKKVAVISGGEKNKVSMAKLLVSSANVLIFDEPTNYLDLASIEAVESALKSYEGTILFVSHDSQFVENIATHYWQISDKKIKMWEPETLEVSPELVQDAGATLLTSEEKMLIENRLSALLGRISMPSKKDNVLELEKEYQELTQKLK
ncbi:MAG: ATP-binding cassette domain-containing protein [Carnobacterium sp.]